MSHDPQLCWLFPQPERGYGKDESGDHTGTPYVQLIALPNRSPIAVTFRDRVLVYTEPGLKLIM